MRLFLLFVALFALGCSSSGQGSASGQSCETDPTQCPTGTTCWPADSVPNLRCLPSLASGTFGASCADTPGAATCADGLACDQLSADAGTCTYYCNSAGHGCPPGYDCRDTHVGGADGPVVAVCRATAPSDAGDDGAGGDDGGGYIDVFIPVPDAGSDGAPSMQ